VNALLATAAWLENLSAITLDQTGLAQKGGAVVSSIILSERPVEASAKIGYGNADLILGFDLLGVAHADNLSRAHPSRTVAVINTAEIPTSNVVRGRAVLHGPGRMIDLIEACTRKRRNIYVDATRIAESLFSSHLAVNVFLLGVAYQGGLVPLSSDAIEEAIRLNRVEADRNLQAFLWGRKYYMDARAVEEVLETPKPQSEPLGLVERRIQELERYQDRRYAEEYRAFVESVTEREPALAETVARYLYKLMAYKDEYEVARLLTDPAFEEQVHSMWESAESIHYNVHPPFLRALGWKKKLQLGPWFRAPLRLLARLKALRGTWFDPFGYARLRKEERALIAWYRNLIEEILAHVTPGTLPLAMEIAALPDQIRGYENLKMEKIREARGLAAEKLVQVKHAPQVPA